MSLSLIRSALEGRLAVMAPSLPTAYENMHFVKPADGGPYQEVHLLPADPITPMDSLTYIEQGIFQVTLCYPLGTGPKDAATRAEAVRAHFQRGTTLTVGGVSTIISHVPVVSAAVPGDGQWRVPVTIRWQAQVFS